MKKFVLFALVILAVVLAGSAYLLLAPVDIDPAVWNPPPAPALEGEYAINEQLAALERFGEDVGPKPEDVAIDSMGRIYGGYEDGRIVRFEPGLEQHHLFADTGGRPLGLAFDRFGNLIVADAVKGLLNIQPDATITVYSEEHGGRPFLFTDDVDIAKDGKIYFSDASDRFGFRNYVHDLMEHRPNGRLLVYDYVLKQTNLLVDNLYFANGVAVSHEQDFILVNETGKYRTLRYWLTGDKAGQTETFLDNLPGFPDGVSAGSNGIFWIAIASPRDPQLDAMLPSPFLRKVVMRLPSFLRPAPQRHSFVLGVDRDGTIVHNLQDPAGAYAPITSVEEHDGMLYFGSIIEDAFARIPVPET